MLMLITWAKSGEAAQTSRGTSPFSLQRLVATTSGGVTSREVISLRRTESVPGADRAGAGTPSWGTDRKAPPNSCDLLACEDAENHKQRMEAPFPALMRWGDNT